MEPSESSATTLTLICEFSVKDSPSCGDVMLQVGGSLIVSVEFPPLSELFVGLSFVHPNVIARMQMRRVEINLFILFVIKGLSAVPTEKQLNCDK